MPPCLFIIPESLAEEDELSGTSSTKIKGVDPGGGGDGGNHLPIFRLGRRISNYPPFFYMFNEILLFHNVKNLLIVRYSTRIVDTVSVSVILFYTTILCKVIL